MKKLFVLFTLLTLTIFITACGGGGSSTPTNAAAPVAESPATPSTPSDIPTVPDSPGTVAGAAEYSGSWNGSYTLTGVPGATPLSLTLVGVSNTGLVTGSIYSQYVFGPVVGSVTNDGTATLSVQNGADGSTWAIALTKTTNGITITSIKNAASGQTSLGSGSCTKTVVGSFDLSGQYPVRFQQTLPSGSSAIRSATMVLAKSSDSEYIGAILGDGGLKAKIRFFRTSGYWFAVIPAAGSEMGTYINSSNGLLTQSPPITDSELFAAMNDGVVTSSGMSGGIAPLRAEMYGSYKITVNGNQFDTTSIYSFSFYFEGTP